MDLSKLVSLDITHLETQQICCTKGSKQTRELQLIEENNNLDLIRIKC